MLSFHPYHIRNVIVFPSGSCIQEPAGRSTHPLGCGIYARIRIASLISEILFIAINNLLLSGRYANYDYIIVIVIIITCSLLWLNIIRPPRSSISHYSTHSFYDPCVTWQGRHKASSCPNNQPHKNTHQEATGAGESDKIHDSRWAILSTLWSHKCKKHVITTLTCLLTSIM